MYEEYFDEGYEAFEMGLRVYDNPHTEYLAEDAWEDGWFTARAVAMQEEEEAA